MKIARAIVVILLCATHAFAAPEKRDKLAIHFFGTSGCTQRL